MAETAVKVFISYAREDCSIAKRLYYELQHAGAKPWLDTEDLLPSQPWKIEVKRAIEECTYFLALLSSHSVSKRGFVQSELKQALEILDEFPESDVFIIPVRVDECSPSHRRLRALHWVDLFPSFEDGLRKIKTVVFGKLEEGREGLLSPDNRQPHLMELKRLKREAMAAMRRDPEDIELFEQKLHEMDLLEDLPREAKAETLNELGLEVTLNSDKGTHLLLQRLLWQIVPTDWPNLSFAEEILGDLETGRRLLETISSILWTWGVQAVEYRRGKEIIQEIRTAILEIHGKAVLIGGGQAQKDCKSALHAMVQKAKAENRYDIIDLLGSSIKE